MNTAAVATPGAIVCRPPAGFAAGRALGARFADGYDSSFRASRAWLDLGAAAHDAWQHIAFESTAGGLREFVHGLEVALAGTAARALSPRS